MKRFSQGFSLIELMFVVGIIGILFAIAIPSYQSYVRRGQESAAKAVLFEIAQRQVQYRVDRRGSYCCSTGFTADAAGAELVLTGLRISVPSEVRTYFSMIPWVQDYVASPYAAAEFAFCLQPTSSAVPGTRAYRIDQSGRRTVGANCVVAAAVGAETW